jgi:hypothetical protein
MCNVTKPSEPVADRQQRKRFPVAATYRPAAMRNLFIAAAMMTAMNGAATAMSVTDFLLDADGLEGQTVSVSGLAVCMGADLCVLYQGATNLAQSITFDPKGLSREVRKYLLECSALLHWCNVTITGRVGNETLHRIVAENVEVGSQPSGSGRQTSPQQPPLVVEWAKQNELCRGGTPDNPATGDACKQREIFASQLRRDGWCFGRNGELGYQMAWHVCD